jgi:putative tRNA adenosine deaminase-associated protein
VSYFAAALARTEDGWTGQELDLDEVEDLDALADVMRDQAGDGQGPSLLLFEEDDEYVAVVRVDGGAHGLDAPRVFLSDRRAVQGSDVAAMLWPDDIDETVDDDEDSGRPVVEPVGDSELLADLGTPGPDLLRLCATEGLLPADVLTGICERAGCLDTLEELREG